MSSERTHPLRYLAIAFALTSLSLAAVLKLTGSVGLCVLYHGWTNALFMLFPLEMSPAYWALHILEGAVAAGACVWAESCRKSSA